MTAHYDLAPDLEQILRPQTIAPRDLAEPVRRLSDLFNGLVPWQSDYGRDPRLREAYLSYYLPTNLPKIRRPLEEWLRARPDAFARDRLRVIDLGCGPGTMLLGLADFVRRLPADRRPARLELVAVDEHAENLREAERLLAALAAADPELPPFRFEALRLDVVGDRRALLPLAVAGGRFDLAILAHVVCELERAGAPGENDAEALVRALALEAVSPEGAIVVVEPALRDTARALERLRDRWIAATDLVPVAPCVDAGPCPALLHERDWCVSTLPWEPPDWIAEIDRRTGLDKHALKLAYLVLARGVPAPASGTWRVVSEVLDLKGELRVYLCGEGRWIVLRHLKRRKGPLADAIRGLGRGDRVAVTGLEAKGPLHVLGERGTIRILASD